MLTLGRSHYAQKTREEFYCSFVMEMCDRLSMNMKVNMATSIFDLLVDLQVHAHVEPTRYKKHPPRQKCDLCTSPTTLPLLAMCCGGPLAMSGRGKVSGQVRGGMCEVSVTDVRPWASACRPTGSKHRILPTTLQYERRKDAQSKRVSFQ